jgi:hypothetical protein
MRLGTPSGLSTMSTGLPSGRNGMSSSGHDAGDDALVAVAAAILSPTEILRFSARYTFTSWITPGRQLVRLQDAVDPLLRLLLDARLLVVGGVDDRADLLVHLLVGDAERLEVERRDLEAGQHVGRDLRSRRDRLLHRAALERQRNALADEQLTELAVAHVVHAQLLLASSRRTSPIRSPRSFSTTWSSMREKIFTSMTTPSMPGGTFSDESFTSFAFSPKIAVSSFSSGLNSCLALRRDLSDQDVARLDVRADADDAALVEI